MAKIQAQLRPDRYRVNLQLRLRGERAMRKFIAATVLAALALTVGAARAAPLAAFGKLPTIEEVTISPSGAQLAVVVTNGEERLVGITDVASGKPTFHITAGGAKIRSVLWAGESHLVVVTSATSQPMYLSGGLREWTMAQSIDLTARKAHQLMGDVDLAMNAIFGEPVVRQIQGQPAVFVVGLSFAESNHGHFQVFRVDPEHQGAKLVERGSEGVQGFLVGPDAQVAAEEVYDSRTGKWELRVKAPNGWRIVHTETASQDPPSVLGLGRGGKSIVYSARESNHRVWREIHLDGGTDPDPQLALEDQGPITDPLTGEIIGTVALVGDDLRYHFFDPKDEAAWKATVNAFAGDRVQLRSMSADRQRIVVRVDSATAGPAFALVDLATRKATWIGAEYAGVGAADIAVKRPIRFKARDGLELNGYLTLPAGKPEKNLPLVVFPHGGPAARDTPGFDWWAQAMASRGYAVLQVNYRGSAGYGVALLEAGYGQWGRKMQTDLSDGVAWLAASGAVDPKRVCIVGASYGGYAALAGVTLDPGVYRCAVSVAGVADLHRQVLYSRDHDGLGAERYWTRFMGADSSGDAVLAKYSPDKLADVVNVPVLLVHGQDDTVVPIEQSRLMADALQRAGKPVELVVLKSDDHWLSRGATRLQMLQATMAFLEKNNPPN
jgi:dipeptidyl aminopeptidase/acylaminoacyl peptidase